MKTIILIILLNVTSVLLAQDNRRVVLHYKESGHWITYRSIFQCLPLQEAEFNVENIQKAMHSHYDGFVEMEQCGTVLPEHTKRRACINFTASWCDDTYTDGDVYELWTAGMRRVFKDQLWVYGLAPPPLQLLRKTLPIPERWSYTLCIGFTGFRCDESYKLMTSMREINSLLVSRDYKVDVMLPPVLIRLDDGFNPYHSYIGWGYDTPLIVGRGSNMVLNKKIKRIN